MTLGSEKLDGSLGGGGAIFSGFFFNFLRGSYFRDFGFFLCFFNVVYMVTDRTLILSRG